LPFIVGQIAPRFYRLHENAFAHKFRHVVQAAQATVARADPYAALVETIDLPQSDNMHYDTGGQLELGKRFAHAWLSIAGRINDVPDDDTRWVSCRSRGETPGS
jgi:hypothetical protein